MNRYVARQRRRPAPPPVLEGNLGCALGALAERLTTQGRYSEAVQVALAAVHLAERNINEAVRRFELFRADLGRELGVAPPDTSPSSFALHPRRRQSPSVVGASMGAEQRTRMR
ncbi:hypothetical protein AB0B74_17555 [Micromonospora parva]|uniref:hypothetical protein n=1 Tax=Micromonospora parva TaxID=1464048 RepID=UPI0033F78B2F